MPSAAAVTALAGGQRRRPFLKVVAAVFRRGADAVIYTSLAASGSHSLGVALEVLGRWVFGSGSAAEAVGAAVRSGCYLVFLRLLPVYAPLLLMRIIERAKFDRQERKKEERRDKEGEKRNREQPLLLKGFKLAALYTSAPLCQLMCIAVTMKRSEEGSLTWRVGSVLYDVTCLGFAVSTAFLVRNLVFLVMVPRVKDGIM
ncbi:hypothetical protein QOZ80_8AG0630580 [Eleusine coracana subsp. coracana]|nr:hypothetical protein QOZ80_8AG0630580 [Eleusine coracana subsp. coracana]